MDVTKKNPHTFNHKYKKTLEIIMIYLASCVPYITRVIDWGDLLDFTIDKSVKNKQRIFTQIKQ